MVRIFVRVRTSPPHANTHHLRHPLQLPLSNRLTAHPPAPPVNKSLSENRIMLQHTNIMEKACKLQPIW